MIQLATDQQGFSNETIVSFQMQSTHRKIEHEVLISRFNPLHT